MPLIIYVHHNSEPCRAVLSLANFLKIPHEIKVLQIYRGEARTPKFKAINPLGKVPTIIDEDGVILSESHTILRYLCRKYKALDHWYPNDPIKAAKVDLYLDWHQTNTRRIYNFFIAMATPMFPKGHFDYYDIDAERIAVERTLKLFETVWLKKNKFLAGDEISIADISAASEIIALVAFEWDLSEYPKTKEWHDRIMKNEEMQKGHEGFFALIKEMKENKRPFPKL